MGQNLPIQVIPCGFHISAVSSYICCIRWKSW